MRANLPYLSGSESRNPQFVYANQPSQSYPRAASSTQPGVLSSLSLSGTSGTTDTIVIRFSFSLANRDGTKQCHQAIAGFNTTNTSNDPTNLGQSCTSSGAVPVILHLLGSKNVDANTGADVEMRIVGPGIDRLLGGQEIVPEISAQNGASYFVPRGIIKDPAYSDSAILEDGSEITDYGFSLNPNSAQPGKAIELEPDVEYRLRLRLTDIVGPGSASWTPTALHIYTPQYESGPAGTVELGCFASSAEAIDSEHFSSYLTQPQQGTAPCTPQAQSLGCPSNQGVSDAPGPDGLIRNSSQAASLCPAPTGSNDISWSETSISIPHQETWEYTGCGYIPAIPENLSAYPKLTWPPKPEPSLTVYKPISNYAYSEEKTPTWVLANEPAYACGAFAIGSTCFDEDFANCSADISQFDLLNGHEEIDLGKCAEEHIKSELDPLAQTVLGANSYFLNVKEKTNGSIKSDSPPLDPTCTAYRMEYKEGDFTQLTAEPLAAPQKPIECDGAGALTCYSQFVGFDSSTDQSTVDFDSDKAAQHFGFREIQAAVPRARINCAGPYCTEISINPVVSAGNTNFDAQASMEIPLNLLFGKTIKFTSKAKDSDKFEADFD